MNDANLTVAAATSLQSIQVENLLDELNELRAKAQMIEGERNALIEVVVMLMDRLCQK